MATAKPNTGQTYSDSPGYSINEHGYQYDARYGNYDSKTDYTAKLNRAVQGGNNKAAAYYEAMANQKVQDLHRNDPKYHTQNNYGSYLNQISDSYLNYLRGKSNDAYTVDSNVASMLGKYDKTFQYSDAIKQADKEGNYNRAAALEYLMNQKIKSEGLPYIQQDNYSSYLNGMTQSDVNMALRGVDVTPTGRYYKVNPDGQSPKGLQAGDYVVTGGGTFMITGVNDDGTYSDAIKVDGGTTTGNYKGTYSTPSSVLQQQGLESSGQRAANPEDYTTLNAPDASAFQVKPVDVGNIDMTSTGQIPQMRDVFMPSRVTEDDLNQFLEERYGAARQQALNQVDYATRTGEQELQRAYDDSLPTYAAQRGQAELEGNKNAKNAALYAEQRGDRGGIGAAQYNALQIAKANQLNQINAAQNKAASDTARAIADLRAKGEFEKADKLLQLTQDYLSQLMSNKQWIANYDVTLSQLDMQARNAEREDLYNQMAVTGRTPDGGYTMEGNKANLSAATQLAPYIGTIFGQRTLQAQQQNLDNMKDYMGLFGVDQNGNLTLQGREFLDNRRNAYADRYGVDPVTGLPTANEAQRNTDNWYQYMNTFETDPNTGLTTAAGKQRVIDNANTERDYALNLAQSFAQWGILPSTQQLNQAGVTDTAMQAQIRYYAQMMAAQNLVNGGAEAMMLYPNGYPTGTASSVTTGGGVGTSTGSGGSGGSGGSKKSGSSSTPTPPPAAAASTPKTSTKVDAVSSAQPASKTQSVVKQVNDLLRNT